MFGWFGEVGGDAEKSYASMCVEFLLFGREKNRETTKIIIRIFNTSNSPPILFFVPETLNPFCFENTKRRAPENGSKSAPSKVDLEPYGAIWCQIGSQFLSPKTKNSS